MSGPSACERVVVVHGPGDPIVSAALQLAGLAVVFETETVAVWVPAGWELDSSPVSRWMSGARPVAIPDFRCDITEGAF